MSTVTRRMGLPTRADLPFFVPYGFSGCFALAVARSRELGGGGNQSWPGARSNIWHTSQNVCRDFLGLGRLTKQGAIETKARRDDNQTNNSTTRLWWESKRKSISFHLHHM
jgi:hypothetical protein